LAPRGNQIEATRNQFFADELLGHIAHGNNATTAQDHAINFRSAMRKAKNAAGRDKFGDLIGSKSETALA
jgi:hypothetical protein